MTIAKPHHPALAFLVSLSVAGTCLAAPGLAYATGAVASAADDASADAAAAETVADETASDAASTSTPYAIGGIQVSLPDDFEVADLGGMLLATNDDASVIVNVIVATPEEALSQDSADWQAYFAPLAESSLEEFQSLDEDATMEDRGVYELESGLESYLYMIEFTSDETGAHGMAAQCYVPLEDGTFALVQIIIDADSDAAIETGDAVSETIALATDEAVVLGTSSEAVELTQTETAGGISIGLPEGFELDAESSTEDDPTWYSADGMLVVGVMSQLVDDVASIGSEESFDLVAEGVAQSLGGSVSGSTVLDNGTAQVNTYVFTFTTDDGTEFVGTLGLITVADSSVTGVLALAPLDEAASVDAAVTAIFESIELA